MPLWYSDVVKIQLRDVFLVCYFFVHTSAVQREKRENFREVGAHARYVKDTRYPGGGC
jgi:hypothetical protein